MNCLHCQTELTKVANHAIDEFLHSNMQDRFSSVTYLTCPKCNSGVQVFEPKKERRKKSNYYERYHSEYMKLFS
jgi:uncharacterized protein with PIN domain|tara:strand:+ start:203 stop:424 length:222 start_codon:yes stop_codon:yes gene_type:complete